MKAFILVAILVNALAVRSIRCEDQLDSAAKTTTLSELSKASGVKVTVYKYPQPEDDHSDIPGLPKPDFDHPKSAVKILFFPGATVFGPDFFKDFGQTFSPWSSTMFPTDLKLLLVVRGAEQTALARVPLAYRVVLNDDGPLHFEITFTIAPDTMKNSYLLIDEYPSSTHYVPIRTKVYLGAAPDEK